jgi:RNA polymerase sigma factor (sigma-70 family)
VRSGDVASAAAFAALYERHHRDLYRYCRSILRDDHDAQDALQSTMTRAFAALRDERRDFELRPWLFRIAHNEAVTALRRRRAAEPLDEQAAAAGAVDEQVALGGEVEALRSDLGALPERQRAALVLRELSGLSHVEIAGALDATPQLVKQLIFQARTALMQAREGREMECADVRRVLSDGDGRVLRGTRIRAHLRCCPPCRRFREDLERRPQALAQLAPPLPPAAAAALLERLLPAAAGAGGAASATAGTVAMLGPKTAATLAVIAAAAGGGAAAHHTAPPRPAVIIGAPPAAATPAGARTGAKPRWAASGRPAVRSTAPGKPYWVASGRRKANRGDGHAPGSRRNDHANAAAPHGREKTAGPATRGNGHATANGRGNGHAAPASGRGTVAAPRGSAGAARASGRSTVAASRGGHVRAAPPNTASSAGGATRERGSPAAAPGRAGSGAAALRPTGAGAGRGRRSGGSAAVAPPSPAAAAPVAAGSKFGARSRLPGADGQP